MSGAENKGERNPVWQAMALVDDCRDDIALARKLANMNFQSAQSSQERCYWSQVVDILEPARRPTAAVVLSWPRT
jgi:hypothetical protein